MLSATSPELLPSIPVERQRFLLRKLQQLGITPTRASDEDLFRSYFRENYRKAIANGQIYPSLDYTQPFLPPANFLSP